MNQTPSMDFKCTACKQQIICTPVNGQIPWPHEYENLQGHFYALCRSCAMQVLRPKLNFAANPAAAREIITHHFKTLRARMLSKGVKELECDGGIIYIGGAFGVDNPVLNEPIKKAQTETERGAGEETGSQNQSGEQAGSGTEG